MNTLARLMNLSHATASMKTQSGSGPESAQCFLSEPQSFAGQLGTMPSMLGEKLSRPSAFS